MDDKTRLLNVLKRILKRLRFFSFINYMLQGLAVGLGALSIFSVASIFIPIPKFLIVSLIILSVSMLVHIILSFIFRPTLMDAAKAADTLGLKDRAASALEFMDAKDEMSSFLLTDAVHYTEMINIKLHIRYKLPKNILIMLSCLLITAVVPTFIDSPARIDAKNYENVLEVRKESKKELQDKVEELADNIEMTEDLRAELEKLLKQALNEVKSARTREEVKKAEDRFAKKLEQQFKSQIKDSLAKSVADTLNSLAKGELTPEEAAKKLEELQKEAEKLDASDKAELMEKVESLLQDDVDLQESLNQLTQLSPNIGQLAQNSQGSQQQGNPSQNNGTQQQGQQGQNQGQQQGQGQEQQSGQGQSQQQGQGQQGEGGQGQGNMEGQGQGQAQGQGQGSQGSGAGSGGGWNTGSFTGHEAQHKPGSGEELSIPNYSDEYLTGTNNGSGNSYQQKADQFLAVPGGSSDYERVRAQYEQKAYESFNTEKIPESLQDIIRDYFSDISYGNPSEN